MESTDLSALRQTTSILCLRLSELLLDTDLHANHTKMGDIIFTLTSVSRALCIRSASRLDFGQHHPNIQSVRTGHRRTWDYVGKDGDIVYEIGDPPDPNWWTEWGRGDSVWSEAVRAESEEEFIRSCETELRDIISYITDNSNNTPRSSMEFVHNHTNRQPLRTLLTENCRMEEPGDYRRQRRRTQTEKSNPWGPTRTGKTVWLDHWVRSLTWGSAPAPPVSYSTPTLMALTLT